MTAMNSIDGGVDLGARVKPLLRGVSHQLALLALFPAVGWLVWSARATASLLGCAIYGASVLILFSTSTLYHRLHWPEPQRTWLGRIDHAAIFVLIAGTFTPFGLAIAELTGRVALVALWLGALFGIFIVVRPDTVGKKTRSALYVALGWFVLPAVPALYRLAGARGVGLVIGGGALYTLGALVYAARRPDPFTRVFGFHEIFHLLVIAATTCHFVAVAGLIVR